MLVVKTRAALLDELVTLVNKTILFRPEIIALPIIGGNPDYLAWLEKKRRNCSTNPRYKKCNSPRL